jgi:hypothetical protein
MKRSLLTLLVLCAVPAYAQNMPEHNCCTMNVGATQKVIQYVTVTSPVYGEYIGQQTDTEPISCWNNSTSKQCTPGISYSPNIDNGYGWGGYVSKVGFVACDPTFVQQKKQIDPTTNGPWEFTSQAYNFNGADAAGNCMGSGIIGGAKGQYAVSECEVVLCRSTSTPVVIDFSGAGFFFTDYEHGVTFDMAGNGHPIKMAWIAQGVNNAFLTLPGPDGLVHTGKELFGNYTPQPFSQHPNGFAALAVYDQPDHGGNGDGIIDARDAIFSSLRLWVDKNHDGISTKDELYTLPELGVNSISLHYTPDHKTDQYGNIFGYRTLMNPDHPDQVDKTAYDVFFVTCN